MLSPIAASKVSQQLVANEIAKAQALVTLHAMVSDGNGHYRKQVGGWVVDLHTHTCDCPAYQGRWQTAQRIDEIAAEITLAVTERERAIKVKALDRMSPFPGLICKHLLAAEAEEKLISLKDEWAPFPLAMRQAAKIYYERELSAQRKMLADNDPEPRVVPSVRRETPRLPLPVPVIEVKGYIDPKTNVQWGIPLSRNGTPPARLMFLCDVDADGNFNVQATLDRAQELFPKEHYKVSPVVVGAAACQFYRALPTRFIDGIYC